MDSRKALGWLAHCADHQNDLQGSLQCTERWPGWSAHVFVSVSEAPSKSHGLLCQASEIRDADRASD
ncbi:MAG TPA: hypothetical protein VFT74_13405, partial [Isosphaeraceae bacterium]|nr:hypothetical protein [Isosphaeraceae bacterium]